MADTKISALTSATPADADYVAGVDVSDTTQSPGGSTARFLFSAIWSYISGKLGAYAPLASPAFTGAPTAPTATAGTNTTQIATAAFVQAAIASLVDTSPAALDTLNELAAALGDDANFATTMTNALAGKAATNHSHYKGGWTPSGSFPGGGTALAGEIWRCSSGGTVDGITFVVGDMVMALVNNASTSTYSANWIHIDITMPITSVAGLSGVISAANLTAALNAFTTSLKGLVPASGGGTTNYLRADGTWAAPAGGGSAGTSCYNGTGAALTKGTPVCLAAFDAGSGNPGMAKADADGAGLMPCIGIIGADVAAGASGIPIITGGEITSLNTVGWTLGDRLYVSTAGALTNVRPTAGFVQSVAVVSRVDATLGEIIVSLDEAGTLYTEVLERAISDEATALTTGAAKLTFRMPFGFVLTGIRANTNTAPAGAAIQVDVNLTGTGSIFSTPLTIDDGEKTSVTAATPAVISTTTLADDAEITVDIDQVGSTTPGKGLKLVMYGYRT